MKKRMIYLKYILPIIGMLAGCSNHPLLAYRNSRNAEKLVVRPPLVKQYIDNTFVLPNVGKFTPRTTTPPTA